MIRKIDELERQIERLAAKTPAEKAWEWAFRATVPVAIALAGWAATLERSVNENKREIHVLKATHFTAADAAQLAGEIRAQLAVPPAWVQQQTARLEVKLDGIGNQVTHLIERITRVEAEKR